MNGIIYKITNNGNSKIYIGKTKSSLNTRISGHRSEAKNSRSNQPIHRAIRKYGWEIFKIEIIEDKIESVKELNKRETHYIEVFNSTDKKIGYNILPGGDGGAGVSGKDHYMYGTKNTLLSNRNKENKGKKYEDIYGSEKAFEIKSKISISSSNRTHSEETKNKVSNSKKVLWEQGVYRKPETMSKFGKHLKNKPSHKRIKVYSPELNMCFDSIQSAAAYIGTSGGNISNIINGKLKKIKGYTFVVQKE